jgi:hypothetical protein
MKHPLSRRLKRPRHLSALALALLAGCGSSGSDDNVGAGAGTPVQAALTVASVSSPQGMASGGDSLIQVSDATGAAVDNVAIRLNGRDVTTAFKKAPGGNALLGTVTGMSNGDNKIEVVDATNPAVVRASMTLANYPLQGPILYAPQEQPLACETHNFVIYPGGPKLSDAPVTTPDCTVPTRVDFVYHDASKAGTAVWQRYDIATPPANVEQTTLADGSKVPYIVRIETGVINRGIYQTAVLGDPVANPNPTPLTPAKSWNGKLVYPFGQSCGGGWYAQGTSMGPVGGSTASSNGVSGDFNVLNDLPLRKGYAVANSTLNYFGQNCNHIISAETMMMVKERVAETYGPIRYTMGWGNSGSAMQQSMIADVYPGLLDGVVMMNGFPDNTNIASLEGRLFYNFQLNHSKGGTTENGTYAPVPNSPYDPTYDNATATRRASDTSLLNWSNSDIAAVSGFSTYHSVRQQASFWAGRLDSVLRTPNAGDRDNVTAGAGNSSVFRAVIANDKKYSPANAVTSAPMGTLPTAGFTPPAVSALPPNPTGLRPNVADHNKNTLNTDPATGFARSYNANVGVQYGLNALNSGQITMAQFISLNDKIGGVDADGNHTAARMQPDVEGLKNAYRSGMIMYGGGGLAQTAMLDMDGLNNEASGAGDLHLKFFHYMVRARLKAANGHFDNHVMWNGQANVPAFVQDPHANAASPALPPRPAYSGRRDIVLEKALDSMDRWLSATVNDKTSATRAAAVVRNKPADLVDGCFGASTPGAANDFIAEPQTFGGYNTVFLKGNGTTQPAGTVGTGATPSRCNAMFPASSYPRFEAGEPMTGRVVQCQLKPISAADYAGYAALNTGWTGVPRDADLARLQQVFAGGVCDYSKPGVSEQPLAGTWLRVTGPGQLVVGKPLEK